MTTTHSTGRTFAIDAAHTSVGFSVRHLMISKVRGTFGAVTGTIELPASGIIPLSVQAEIDVTSIDTNQDQRDAHLKSPDFFEADKFPKMHFASTKIEAIDDSRFHLTGELEIRGTKKTVTFEASATGPGKNPFGPGDRVGFEATTKIRRSDFGLTWNSALETGGVAVGDDIEITLDVETVG